MCGIAGYVSINREFSISRLEAMTESIQHRGPDGAGHWQNEEKTVSLGHRRLSIIDLSNAGDQPMHYLDRYTVVYNGEIYNYIEIKQSLINKGYEFRSHSDTEVLLALFDSHKEACLQHLDGMFSFAIYDKKEEILFCARDRFGEKPFFYHYEQNKIFCFGSEMKALWASGIDKSVDDVMLYNYLSMGYLQNPADLSQTFYKGIVRLEAAHYLKIDCKNCRIVEKEKYWKLEFLENHDISEEKASEQFRNLFEVSVKRRLRSDVPVGSSLSGGLDSSLIVMSIDKIKEGTGQVQKTFSARFSGYKKDEGKYMQMVIDRCKVESHFTYPSEESLIEEIEKVFYHQEEPFGSASILAQYEVMKIARKNNVIVLQDGQGADEILAGYHKYFPVFFGELKKINQGLYKNEVRAYEELYQNSDINPVPAKDIKFYARQFGGVAFEKAKRIRSRYKNIVNPEFASAYYKEHESQAFSPKESFATLNEKLLWNISGIGLEQLLRYADRNSMAHGLEVRLPFLSHELAEFLFTIPSNFKIRNGWTKWIMRNAVKDFLPSEIVWRKDKIGYEPPQKKWMEDKRMKELIFEKRKKMVSMGILHPKILSSVEDEKGRVNGDNKRWAHLMAGSLYNQ